MAPKIFNLDYIKSKFFGCNNRSNELRVININDAFGNNFCSNEVVTSQYTALNFVPKNLWRQFHKVSNIYFLLIGVLQLTPSISTTNGFPTIFAPLLFVLVTNALKDAYEDWRRHQADAEENHQNIYVIVPTRYSTRRQQTLEREIQQGVPRLDLNLKRNSFEEGVSSSEEFVYDGAGENLNPKLPSFLVLDQPLHPVKSVELLEQEGVIVKNLWKHISVGDIVLCRNRERFPADMILLSSSDKHGIAMVETASLDGETNLKMRQAHPELSAIISQNLYSAIKTVGSFSGKAKCFGPDGNFKHFEGVLKLKYGNWHSEIPLSNNQLILRGCRLRNTGWILGLVVYSGKETKIQMNSFVFPNKYSEVEKFTNKSTYLIFVFQIILCLICAILTVFVVKANQNISYLNFPNDQNLFTYGIKRFFTWLIMLSNMVPISLNVTMGMVKAGQGVFIGLDNDMWHENTDTRAVVRNSNLNEELGQVEYVFTDKTGTLTQNCMEFSKCCIDGVSYENTPQSLKNKPKNQIPHVNLNCSELDEECFKENFEVIDFFLHLAVNHNVAIDNDVDLSASETVYSFSSPDEGALVYGAYRYHIKFIARTAAGVRVEILGQPLDVTILATIDFTSARQRSSVFCRFFWKSKKPRYVLFCKGSDTAITKRLKYSQNPKEYKIIEAIQSYAQTGLRTLCIAKKELSELDAREWLAKYGAASLSLNGRKEKLHQVAALIERDLEIQGVTGVEDLLQDGVSDTLMLLREAGMMIWMLTGDKVETAINVGVSANILSQDTLMYVYQWDSLIESSSSSKCLNSEREKELESAKYSKRALGVLEYRMKADLADLSAKYPEVLCSSEKTFRSKISKFFKMYILGFDPAIKDQPQKKKLPPISLVIDGDCLAEILKNNLTDVFLKLCQYYSAVLCCRSTPYQKGAVVTLIKQKLKKITLAIGDGANDCNMINSANVGVGLRGLEGMQAFNDSDYGISQFRFLGTLLICHGRWCYRRLARLVLYMFYKNVVLLLPIFYLSPYSLFTGQKIYDEYIYQMYNVILTSLPVIIFGIFDQDVDKNLSKLFPQLYIFGPRRYFLNLAILCRWLTNGVLQSAIITIIPFIAFNGSKIVYALQPAGLWFAGQCIYLLVILIVNFKILCESSHITYLMWLSLNLSFLAWVMLVYVASSFPSVTSDLLGLAMTMISTPMFYFVLLGSFIICISLDIISKSMQVNFTPELIHIIQQKGAKSVECFSHKSNQRKL